MDTPPYPYATVLESPVEPIRRVVTGHDPQGKARIVDDRAVEPFTS